MCDIDEKSKRAKRIKDNKRKAKNLNSVDRDEYKPPKNWKHVYLRSEKMRRAKQLGFEYPRKDCKKLIDEY